MDFLKRTRENISAIASLKDVLVIAGGAFLWIKTNYLIACAFLLVIAVAILYRQQRSDVPAWRKITPILFIIIACFVAGFWIWDYESVPQQLKRSQGQIKGQVGILEKMFPGYRWRIEIWIESTRMVDDRIRRVLIPIVYAGEDLSLDFGGQYLDISDRGPKESNEEFRRRIGVAGYAFLYQKSVIVETGSPVADSAFYNPLGGKSNDAIIVADNLMIRDTQCVFCISSTERTSIPLFRREIPTVLDAMKLQVQSSLAKGIL